MINQALNFLLYIYLYLYYLYCWRAVRLLKGVYTVKKNSLNLYHFSLNIVKFHPFQLKFIPF